MDHTRLIQCQGNNLAYIKHLELRIIELESACSSRYPETSGVQQQISGQYRHCNVCRDLNLSTQDVGASQEISADSIRLASESRHDNQSSQHNNRPPGSTFPFIPYEPPVTTESLVTTDSSALTDSAKQQWNRLDSFASSLSSLPKTSHWRMWNSTSEDQRKNIVLSLVSGLAFPNGDNPISHELPAPISILLEYSKSMEPAEPNCVSAKSESKRPFAYFQELIFCSMCAVALEFTPKEDVFEVMKSVFKSDAKSKTLRTRIHGAKWANRAIYLLSRTNWGSRSWDLIYAANNHVNFYRKFTDYSIKPDDLIPKLKIPEDTQRISVPLAIPSIIRTTFRDLVPLETICQCLGYELRDYNELDLSSLEKVLGEKINTEPSKKRKIGPSITPSKKRRRNSSPRLSDGDPFETSLSESESCSSNDISSPTEGSLESPGDYEVNGLLEEYSISTSTPMESPISNGTTGSNDDRMDANNSDSHPPISKPSLQSILSQSPFPFSQSPRTSSLDPPLPIESLCDWETGDVCLLQQPWNTALPADINPPPPIESLCDWETGDVSLLQQPWNINLPADINPSPPIESLCDWETGDVSLLQQPWNINLPADINPLPPIESLCDWETGDVSLLQQPWNINLPADINPLPPIESLYDWETGDVSLLQQPWNINLPADINPIPLIESLCDHATGDASLLQQPSNIGLPADINPSPPIHLGQGVDTSMLDQILETLNSPSRQSCPASRETTSLRDPETSRRGSPLSGIIYRSVSHPSLSTVAAM